jgi:hypothetical protein
MSIAQFLDKIKPQYIKKILITMPMQSIFSRLGDSKSIINFNSKVDTPFNRWAGIPEVNNNFQL